MMKTCVALRGLSVLLALWCVLMFLTTGVFASNDPRSNYDKPDTDPPRGSFVEASGNVDKDGKVNRSRAVSQMRAAANRAESDTAIIRIMNGVTISQDTLQQIYNAAQNRGKEAMIYADTMYPGFDVYQARLYVDPGDMVWDNGSVRLRVWSDNEGVYQAKQQYLEQYRNHLEVIRCDQNAWYPTRLRIAAKVDLSKLDVSNLHFYSRNRTTENVYQIENPDYWLAESGKLVFHTERAGDILITDRPLVKREPTYGYGVDPPEPEESSEAAS